MDRSTIKLHMQQLAKGYKIWTVPLLMLLWDIAFKTANGNNLYDAIMFLLDRPHFKITAIYSVVLGIITDRWGKLLLLSLTDTSQARFVEDAITKHNTCAMLAMLIPIIYYGIKALTVIGNSLNLVFIADIHGLFTLLAIYDGIKILKCNSAIISELENL